MRSVYMTEVKTMPILRQGSNGPAVGYLQYLLVSYGIDIGQGGIDGIFGQYTMDAVMKFQEQRNAVPGVNPGQLEIDGVVDSRTWNALANNFCRTCRESANNEDGEPAVVKGYTELPVLSKGDSGEAVKFLQQMLLGYEDISRFDDYKFYTEYGNGYGEYTVEAVKTFQSCVGIEIDGIVGPLTWINLFLGACERCNRTVG